MSICKKVDLLEEEREEEIPKEFFFHMNDFHNLDIRFDKEIEQLLVDQQLVEIESLSKMTPRPHRFTFSPSGASKCARELYYKLTGERPIEKRFPYQRRWTRNSTAVHSAVQRDLLYAEKYLKNNKFSVHRLNDGLPAWEHNIKQGKVVEFNGTTFAIQGMMDGIVTYEKDSSQLGFEFKTKSNTNAQVGNYLLKDVASSHKLQCVAYSLLFGLDEFIVMYEAVAKDSWTKGEDARSDIRVFYYKVSHEDRQELLGKFAYVTKCAINKTLPPREEDKCLFCTYKHLCNGGEI